MTESPPPVARTPWWRRSLAVDLALLVALLVALALLWGRSRHVWYWLDEGIALGIASHPLGSIPELLRQDGSPPLYYLLLHVWVSAFGTSEAQTHLLSSIFALATVPAAFWAGRSLFDRRVGWMCALMAAISPFVAAHANETRMYSLAVLLALVATASLLHAFVHRRRGYLPVFTLSLVLLLYTHNWGLFFGLGTGVAVALRLLLGGQRRSVLADAAMAFAGVALLYSPWVPTLLYQREHTGIPSAPGPTLGAVRDDLTRLVGGREIVVALGLTAGVALADIARRRRERAALAVAMTAVIPAVALAAAWAASTSSSVWSFRYLAVAVPPILLLAGIGLGHAGRVGAVALVVVAFLAAPIEAKGPAHRKSNVKELAERASPLLGRGDMVVSAPGEVPLLAHYLPEGLRFATPTGPVRDVGVVDWRDVTKRLSEADVRASVGPLLDAVALGGHMLVVCPPPGPNLTTFVRVNFRRCDEARSLVGEDDRFRLDLVVRPRGRVHNTPAHGHLFTRHR